MKKKVITTLLMIAVAIGSFFAGANTKANYINPESEEFHNNYINMEEVIDFEATETGLMLYTINGDGYYWGE